MEEITQNERKQTAQGQPANNSGMSRKKRAMLVFAILTVVAVVTVFFYMRYKSTHITTDDAFIDGNIHTIACKVNGTVKSILVKSNQYVKAGDILVAIDPVDYEVRVKEAASSLNSEKAKLAEVDARIEAARKQLAEAESKADAARAFNELQQANLEQARKDRDRAENLVKKDAISKERYDRAITAYKVAVAQVKAANENLKGYVSTIETQRALLGQAEAARVAQVAAIKQKEAVLEGARLHFGYTTIYSPVDGYITKKSVEVGNQIQAGQPLMAVVPLSDIYVTANYKETQLAKVRPGQDVDIEVDTYPGKVFKGKVESIMAGTGSVFSLFPPENATGNFVKVVQRIPVKIVFEQNTDPEHVLRMGMSVVPTVIIAE